MELYLYKFTKINKCTPLPLINCWLEWGGAYLGLTGKKSITCLLELHLSWFSKLGQLAKTTHVTSQSYAVLRKKIPLLSHPKADIMHFSTLTTISTKGISINVSLSRMHQLPIKLWEGRLATWFIPITKFSGHHPVSWLVPTCDLFSSAYCRDMMISSPLLCMQAHVYKCSSNVFKILAPAQTECCNTAISTQIVSTSSKCKFSNNIWIWF